MSEVAYTVVLTESEIVGIINSLFTTEGRINEWSSGTGMTKLYFELTELLGEGKQ